MLFQVSFRYRLSSFFDSLALHIELGSSDTPTLGPSRGCWGTEELAARKTALTIHKALQCMDVAQCCSTTTLESVMEFVLTTVLEPNEVKIGLPRQLCNTSAHDSKFPVAFCDMLCTAVMKVEHQGWKCHEPRASKVQ